MVITLYLDNSEVRPTPMRDTERGAAGVLVA